MYFQLMRIMDTNALGEPFVPFIKAYASYAFKRVTAFEGGLKAVSATLKGKKTPEGVAVDLLTAVEAIMLQGTHVKVLLCMALNVIIWVDDYCSANLHGVY